MLTVEEALARILDEVAPLGTETVPLLEAQGTRNDGLLDIK